MQVATNHYRLLFKPEGGNLSELDDTSCCRYEAALRLFANHPLARPIKDTALLQALTEPTVIQEITAQHVIIRPRTQEIWLFVPARLVV